MTTTRQTQRQAKRLFKLCQVNGSLDESRVRRVVQRVVDARRSGSLALLSRFQRLLRLDRVAHSATVESATPLADNLRADIEAGLAHRYGRDIVTTFSNNPALIGGVRIRVGSEIFDGSIKAGLARLEARF